MPVHVVEKLNKIVRTERALRAKLGREPSAIEIGLELDLQPEEIDQIRRSAQTPISLEKPVGDEDESEFGHFLTDETMPLPDEVAEETLRNEALRSILKSLSHRERRVLELRYGLDGEQPRTLDEVGKAFNVTRERIRQIENQGLKKLRALALAAQLRDVAVGSFSCAEPPRSRQCRREPRRSRPCRRRTRACAASPPTAIRTANRQAPSRRRAGS